MSEVYKNNIIKILTIVYFVNGLIEVVAEQYHNQSVIYITKPLIPIFLMIMYWETSRVRNSLFFLTLFFSVLTNLLFIPNNDTVLFYGIIAFTIHRLIMLYYIFKIVKVTNLKPFILSTIPVVVIFFYLYIESSYLPKNSIPILIFQIFLIGSFGGFALSKYLLEDNKQNSYLMICALLFIALQFIIFIEKYFLHAIPIESLRPIAMSLNVLAFFAFYKFIEVYERNLLNNN